MRPVLLLLLALGLGTIGWGYWEATSDPVVRRAAVAMSGWPEGAPHVKALLVSDIHVAGPDMPPERLGRIVGQINALKPDIVLIAGDLVSDKRVSTHRYEMAEALAPLRELRAKFGAFAVFGNHDHWRSTEQTRAALRLANVTLIENGAAAAGPLVIGGLDDDHTGRARLDETLAAMRGHDGARLILSHTPDPFPDMPADVPLMLAGHTHCGQIAPPLIGPVSTMSRHGKRYACGLVREGRKTLVVGAGVGTSILPLRIGAPPDMWLITLGPSAPITPAAAR